MEIYDDGKNKYEIDIKKKLDDQKREYFVVTVDGFPYRVDAKKLNDGRLEFSFNGETYKVLVTKDGEYRLVFHEGHSFKIRKNESSSFLSDDQGLIADKVLAPMPSVIIQYLVNEGDEVKANQKVVILEAMKMQNTLVSPYDGTVKKIPFKAGEQVGEGTELIIIDKIES